MLTQFTGKERDAESDLSCPRGLLAVGLAPSMPAEAKNVAT